MFIESYKIKKKNFKIYRIIYIKYRVLIYLRNIFEFDLILK